jgi:hypothetical protein
MDPLAPRVLRRFAGENAEAFAADFFKRHPALHRYAPKRVRDEATGSGSAHHPEASQHGNLVLLYPKFWTHDAGTRDFIFAHELGHYRLAEFGLQKMIETCQKFGIDPWDTSSLPFAQSNMDEAFADCFASFHLTPGEVTHRYPAWAKLVHEVG